MGAMNPQSVVRMNGGTTGKPFSVTASADTRISLIANPATVPSASPIETTTRCSAPRSRVIWLRRSPSACRKPVSALLCPANEMR